MRSIAGTKLPAEQRQAAEAGQAQAKQQGHHHGAAGRVVAQVAPGTQVHRVLDERLDCGRPVDEIAETRMAGTDKTPQQAQRDQSGDRVAGHHVQGQQLLFRDVRNDESCRQAPVEHSHENVPHFDFVLHHVRHSGLDLCARA